MQGANEIVVQLHSGIEKYKNYHVTLDVPARRRAGQNIPNASPHGLVFERAGL
jgi:hypothetical protein